MEGKHGPVHFKVTPQKGMHSGLIESTCLPFHKVGGFFFTERIFSQRETERKREREILPYVKVSIRVII